MSCFKVRQSGCSSGVYTVRRLTMCFPSLCVSESNTWWPLSLLMQGSSVSGCIYSLSISSSHIKIPATGCSPLCNITVTVNIPKPTVVFWWLHLFWNFTNWLNPVRWSNVKLSGFTVTYLCSDSELLWWFLWSRLQSLSWWIPDSLFWTRSGQIQSTDHQSHRTPSDCNLPLMPKLWKNLLNNYVV